MKHFLLVLAIPLFAAPNDWDSLLRISPRQETMVQTIDGKRQTGAFISYADDAVIIQTRKGQLSIEKPRVQLVTARLKPRAHSARKGAIIGGGICLGLAIAGGKEVAAAAPTFAGLGALIGLNQNTMTIIYRKK